MAYSPIFNPSYNAWHDLPTEDTPVTAAVMANYDGAIENIESFLDGSTAIKPVEKTGLMTKQVGVDANGQLFTSPTNESDTIDAIGVNYSNTSSGMTATNVQAAIDELSSVSIDADTVTYDNASSGLTATNVQAAIDEVKSGIKVVNAEVSNAAINTAWGDIYYGTVDIDISALGLTATPTKIIADFHGTNQLDCWCGLKHRENFSTTRIQLMLFRATTATVSGIATIMILD